MNVPLWQAIAANDAHGTERALRRGAEVDYRGAGGLTPLLAAAERGALPIAALLLQHRASLGRNRGGTAPPASWISGAVFQHQINLRLPQAPASLGQVAGLYRAASHTVQALFFTLGASVDLADDRGRTPLMLAACSPNSELVAALLEVHASPH